MGKDVTIIVPDAARASGGQPSDTEEEKYPPIRCPRCYSLGPHGTTWRNDIYQLWIFCGQCGLYLRPLRGSK